MLSFLKPLLYVQISPEQVVIKNLKSGAVLSNAPELAMSIATPSKVLGFGGQARAAMAGDPTARLINPFAHPRSMVSDFTSAEQLLKALVTQALAKSFLSIPPMIVLHPLGSPEGGFTQVERRAFKEMALGAGASEAAVWTGRALTDEEVINRSTPANAGEWGD